MSRYLRLVLVFISFVLACAFGFGLFSCINSLPLDYVPDDNALCCFGIGLCSLPFLFIGCFTLGLSFRVLLDSFSEND